MSAPHSLDAEQPDIVENSVAAFAVGTFMLPSQFHLCMINSTIMNAPSNTFELELAVTQLNYDVEVLPGETLKLPESVVNRVGPGRWRIIIVPLKEAGATSAVRGHSAFLNGYAPEDEGLYEDYPGR